MSRTHPGTPLVLNAGLAASIVLASLTGVVAWWGYLRFTFEPIPPEPAEYRSALTAILASAFLLLVVAPLTTLALRGARLLHALVAAGVAVQLGYAWSCLDGARGEPDPGLISSSTYSFTDSALVAVELPTSWPLLAFLLVGLVARLRGPSSPGPR